VHKLWSSICSILHSSVTSFLLGPTILLSTLFSYILDLCSSLRVRDQVSYSKKITGKIIEFNINWLIGSFYKVLCPQVFSTISQRISCFLIWWARAITYKKTDPEWQWVKTRNTLIFPKYNIIK
jgi:hypothetical protein